VKHHYRCGCGFVANRAASAATGEGSCRVHFLICAVLIGCGYESCEVTYGFLLVR
jgi:hypothetical protein